MTDESCKLTPKDKKKRKIAENLTNTVLVRISQKYKTGGARSRVFKKCIAYLLLMKKKL